MALGRAVMSRGVSIWKHVKPHEITAWKNRHFLTYEELLPIFGISSKATLHNWLRGRTIPSWQTQFRIRRIIDAGDPGHSPPKMARKDEYRQAIRAALGLPIDGAENPAGLKTTGISAPITGMSVYSSPLLKTGAAGTGSFRPSDFFNAIAEITSAACKHNADLTPDDIVTLVGGLKAALT